LHGSGAGPLSKECDVAIVGAGPAGSATALLCARAGLSVVLLDRATFPRPKPCGDCLSPETTRVLDRLGVLTAVLDERPARLAGWRITSPAGRAFEGRFGDIACDDARVSSALAIARDRFDATLLLCARTAGATFQPDAHVTMIQPATLDDARGILSGRAVGQEFMLRASVIVGADGLRSTVARRIGAVRSGGRRLRKISLTAHVTGVHGEYDFGEMHVLDGLCVGLAPVASRSSTGARAHDGVRTVRPDADFVRRIDRALVAEPVTWNLTLVADAALHGRAIAADPGAFFIESLRRFPALRGRLEEIRPVGPSGRGRDSWLLRSGPFDVPTRMTTRENVALVGDAAGYFDPFTGQGIYQAIAGAEQLAAAILSIQREGVPVRTALRSYAHDLRRMVRGPRALQRVIEAVMSRPRLADRATAWLSERPGAVRALLATTGGLAPVRSLFAPATLLAFARLPRQPSSP
jgi:flavin-dependent dehydrogenase